MATQTTIIYGKGGYDPTKPNNNIIEQYEVDVPDIEPSRLERLEAKMNEISLKVEKIDKDKP